MTDQRLIDIDTANAGTAAQRGVKYLDVFHCHGSLLCVICPRTVGHMTQCSSRPAYYFFVSWIDSI